MSLVNSYCDYLNRWLWQEKIAFQRIGICDGGILVFRHAHTEVDYCFIVEDNICRLISNVKPELKLIKVLLPIALPSSPAIANTFVVRSWLPSNQMKSPKEKSDKAALIWFLSLFSYSLFTFFCLDTKESNKEKIKKEKIYSTFLSFALI